MKKTPPKSNVDSPYWAWAAIALFLICFCVGISKQINFSGADLGRHLKNGELLFSEPEISNTNFYSYTEPDFPFINHHWLAGSVFFFVYKISGFSGLHIFYVLLLASSMFLLFRILMRKATWQLSLMIGMCLMPMLFYRKEIRPEGFSYLFLLLWITVLSSPKKEQKMLLIWAFLLQVFWVNTHIFFFMGPMITVFYTLEKMVFPTSENKRGWKLYIFILMIQVIACLFNPNFIKGAISPLTIFNEYGYMVSENQNILFIQERLGLLSFLHVEIAIVIFLIGLIWILFKKKWKGIFPELLLATSGIIFGFIAIRGITYMGIVLAIGIASIVWKLVLEYGLNLQKKINMVSIAVSVVLFFVGIYKNEKKQYIYSYRDWNTGIGLMKGSNRAGEFFNKTGIKGPVFNNYDIGSYFIFHHYPKEKPFVDNRPEAYSKPFFDSVYNPALKYDSVWKKIEAKYNFNCIYFYRHDNSEFGQPFLIKCIEDSSWQPVFVDDYNIILLKNRSENFSILQQFAINKAIFSSVPGN